MPRFSIIIPTRNRASLLKQTLPVNLKQKHDSFEIIVSDNNSSDNTADVVNEAMSVSKEIRYFNPGKDLSMPANFEFALSKASGDYLLFLCDDDVLAFNTLSILDDMIAKTKAEVIVWRKSYYQYQDMPSKGRRGEYKIIPGTQKLYQVESKVIMESIGEIELSFDNNPRSINSCISKKAVQICQDKTKLFFVPPYPDFTCTCQIISNFPFYYYFDIPLYVSGTSVLSNASLHLNRKQKLDSFFSLIKEEMIGEGEYEMKYLNASYIKRTISYFQATHPDFDVEVNMHAYFTHLYKELMFFRPHENIEEEEEEILSMAASCFTGDEQSQLLAKFKSLRRDNATKSKLRSVVDSSRLLTTVGSKYYYVLKKILKGDNTLYFGNVNSVINAAQILTDFLAQKVKAGLDLAPVSIHSREQYQKL